MCMVYSVYTYMYLYYWINIKEKINFEANLGYNLIKCSIAYECLPRAPFGIYFGGRGGESLIITVHVRLQVDLTMWQPSVCLNFLDELLTWIRKTVVKDDPK